MFGHEAVVQFIMYIPKTQKYIQIKLPIYNCNINDQITIACTKTCQNWIDTNIHFISALISWLLLLFTA